MSKICIHAILPSETLKYVRELKSVGKYFKVVKGLDDTGLMKEVKLISPETITILRIYNEIGDNLLGQIHLDTFSYEQTVNQCINLILAKTTPETRQYIDYIEIINEIDPEGIIGWYKFGYFLKKLVQAANFYNIKLALPAFNSGTPEWDEFLALCENGLFALMKETGHILSLHEGVLHIEDPVDLYYPAVLPNGEILQNVGALNLRYRNFRHILKQRNEEVNFVVSEWYAGGGWGRNENNEQLLERFKWYDNEVMKDDYLLGFCPYTIGPSQGWEWSNYEFLYPTLLEYMKNYIEPIPQIQPKYVKVKDIKSIYERSIGRNLIGFIFGKKLWTYLKEEGDMLKISGEFYIDKKGIEIIYE